MKESSLELHATTSLYSLSLSILFWVKRISDQLVFLARQDAALNNRGRRKGLEARGKRT